MTIASAVYVQDQKASLPGVGTFKMAALMVSGFTERRVQACQATVSFAKVGGLLNSIPLSDIRDCWTFRERVFIHRQVGLTLWLHEGPMVELEAGLRHGEAFGAALKAQLGPVAGSG